MTHTHLMPYGARLLPGGGARFSLWAPSATRVSLLLQGGTQHEPLMVSAESSGEGWWHVDTPDGVAGREYQWRINDTLTVPDPASRHNPRGPHAPCVLTDPEDYAWTTDWAGRPWEELVFYELHVGTFTPEGTYAAAAAHLQQLADLGFTAIELMPLAAFGGEWGWGYDGVLPFAPHHAYGTPDELKAFIDRAHALGLCVFIDVVYNHFGPDGNYLNTYADAFFSTTHTSPWGAAINFDQEGGQFVREFFIHNALYWLEEFQADGLRLDAVHAIQDASLPDVLEHLSARVRALEAQARRPLHLVLENELNHGWRLSPRHEPGLYDAQWNDDFHHALHVNLTGEAQGYYAKFAAEPMEVLARTLATGYAFAGTLRGGDATGPAAPLGCMVNFMGNHDQVGNRAFGERLQALAGHDGAEIALLLALLTPATPLVFMGDEFAASTPFLYFANWEGALREAVREGRVREFDHSTDDRRALPDACDVATMHASTLRWETCESPEGRQRMALVKAALDARRHWLQPRAGHLLAQGHTAEPVGRTGLRVTWHYRSGEALQLELNIGTEPVDAPATWGTPAQEVFSHRRGRADTVWPPRSARWLLAGGPA